MVGFTLTSDNHCTRATACQKPLSRRTMDMHGKQEAKATVGMHYVGLPAGHRRTMDTDGRQELFFFFNTFLTLNYLIISLGRTTPSTRYIKQFIEENIVYDDVRGLNSHSSFALSTLFGETPIRNLL